MNISLTLSHDTPENNDCCVCNVKAKNFNAHIKTKKHQYNRESLFNKLLIKLVAEKCSEVDELKTKPSKLIKMYHKNDTCSICLDETKECFNGMFSCTHGICADCFSKVDKCPQCRASIQYA